MRRGGRIPTFGEVVDHVRRRRGAGEGIAQRSRGAADGSARGLVRDDVSEVGGAGVGAREHLEEMRERGLERSLGHLAVLRVHRPGAAGSEVGDAVRAVAAEGEDVDRLEANSIERRGLKDEGDAGIAERQAREARIGGTADRGLGSPREVGHVFAADYHGALNDAQRGQGIGEIERREYAGAGIRDVERQRMAEAEVTLEQERRAGLEGEAKVGTVAAGDIRAEEKVDVFRAVPGAREAVGNRPLGQVDGELQVASHASGPDAREGLKGQQADQGPAAAHHLPGRDGVRRQVDTEALDHRRRLGRGRSRQRGRRAESAR